ncbi:MAG: hypothetical protein ACI8S6_005078, partial [Myxococcota bacterium]
KADRDIYDTGDVVDAVDLDGDGAASDVDCDDDDDAAYPDAEEVCDGVDNNCDGVVDEGVQVVIYEDLDGDGYGNSLKGAKGCPSASTAPIGGDCDDSRSGVNPAAQEVCDLSDVDEDCDGLIDDLDDSTDPTTQEEGFLDADGDGYGADGSVSYACSLASEYIPESGDCDDTDANINPAAREVCDPDDADEDCNGLSEDDDPGLAVADLWYPDSDGDGYGDVQGEVAACEAPSGYIADGEDCDDTDVDANPADGCDWSGTYTGDFIIDASAFKVLADTCTGTAEIEVDPDATPQVTGEVSCRWAGTFDGIFGDITGTLDGDFVAVSDAEGDLLLSTKLSEVMSLEFVAPDYMESTVSGVGKVLTYTITLDLAR